MSQLRKVPAFSGGGALPGKHYAIMLGRYITKETRGSTTLAAAKGETRAKNVHGICTDYWRLIAGFSGIA
jgi:hypothetical protein